MLENPEVLNKTAQNIYRDILNDKTTKKFLKVKISDQIFGINATDVEDILNAQKVDHIPLAPNYIVGSLNLRGKIVTVIDIKKKYGLQEKKEMTGGEENLNVVLSVNDEFYSILVDNVYEVLDLELDKIDLNPPTLESKWKHISSGIYQLENELLILLETQELIKSI